jgi:hypothetical protein
MTRRIDVPALAAAVVAVVMARLYVLLVHSQGNTPAAWVVTVLVAAGLGAAYGCYRRAPRRRVVLGVCTVLLGAVGLLGILSVGLPILLAAGLCLLAVARGAPAPVATTMRE